MSAPSLRDSYRTQKTARDPQARLSERREKGLVVWGKSTTPMLTFAGAVLPPARAPSLIATARTNVVTIKSAYFIK